MNPLTKSMVPSLADASGTGSSHTWLWVLIGVVVVLAVVALLLVRRYSGRYVGRGTVVIGGWLSDAIKASDRGAALHAAIVAAGQPEALAAADSDRWADIRRRAQDLEQDLVSLRRAAPEADDRARVTDALASLRALRYALEDERPGGAGQAAVVRARLDAFEKSLRSLRSPEHHVW
ncbi:MAG TPA: hypothetical protein VMI33_27570 [Streptosporangiaceae bacterium]|nr:hypothetical protein [Streptosporangiaceae bacterium]